MALPLLWLWHRPAIVATIQGLAWEPPYAAGAAPKSKKKSPETNPHIYDQLTLDKGTKNMQWGKIVASLNNAGKIGYSYPKKKKKKSCL